MINVINETSSGERSNYHLTFGKLIDILKGADSEAVFDNRVTGIGSYRGYYIDISLYTERGGVYLRDEEFNGDYKDFDKWEKKHSTNIEKLPVKANELGVLLESFIGKSFTGHKGGNYIITRDKPLWLSNDSSDCSGMAVIDIDNNLKLITKET